MPIRTSFLDIIEKMDPEITSIAMIIGVSAQIHQEYTCISHLAITGHLYHKSLVQKAKNLTPNPKGQMY